MTKNISKPIKATITTQKCNEYTFILINYGQKDKYHIKCGGIILWEDNIMDYISKWDIPIYYWKETPQTILSAMFWDRDGL